ncbi:MAG: site-2 protease family protein [Verrucomicrobiota bacterium]
MDLDRIVNGLIGYLCLIILLTFHEFAHAWVAWKCGDDTARLQGRVSLNPIVHMELIGTVVLPLIIILFGAPLIGWGKPVPVNINNLYHRRRDDTLVAMAGPMMNLLLAVAIMALAKVGLVMHLTPLVDISSLLVQISLLLCFFNLLPVPPLDGSHVLKNAIHMSDELYWRFCQYGFLIILVLIQFPQVSRLLRSVTNASFNLIARLYGIG